VKPARYENPAAELDAVKNGTEDTFFRPKGILQTLRTRVAKINNTPPRRDQMTNAIVGLPFE